MESISNVFKLKISFKERLENLWFIMQVLIGAAIGLVAFAKVLNYLFVHFELQTIALFAGLILLSLPMLKKEEMDGKKINILFFILGVLTIGIINYLSPGEEGNIVTYEELILKSLTPAFIISLILMGVIGGATMIFPGVSGSMVLLVLGWYHMFKGYVAAVTTFDIKILIPLIFIAIGVGLGIIFSAKLTSFLLKKYKTNTMSFILGLIIMSAIVIFPLKAELYTFGNIITSILTFILGGGLIVLLEKFKEKEIKKSTSK
jgi:putative membrane protein